jgi:hypothetical protein
VRPKALSITFFPPRRSLAATSARRLTRDQSALPVIGRHVDRSQHHTNEQSGVVVPLCYGNDDHRRNLRRRLASPVRGVPISAGYLGCRRDRPAAGSPAWYFRCSGRCAHLRTDPRGRTRHATHHGVPHQHDDELKSVDDLTIWMAQRKLAWPCAKTTSAMFETALSLRASLRDYLQHDSAERRSRSATRALNVAIAGNWLSGGFSSERKMDPRSGAPNVSASASRTVRVRRCRSGEL